MATPALHRIQLRTGLYAAAGSTSLGFFASVGTDMAAQYSLDSDETLTLTIPLSDRLAALVKRRQVVRLIFNDATFQEWLIEDVVTETGDGDSVIRLTCGSILMLLADATLMEQVDVTGRSVLAGSYTGTLTQLWDNVLLPIVQAAGITVVDRGQVDPTEVRTFTWAFGDTPLSLLRASAGITKTELRLRRNGLTGYLVDWIYKINGSMAPVTVRARKNLRALRHTESAREQATILYGQGATDSGGVNYSLEGVLWQASAVNGGTMRVTLASPIGGPGPIAEDGQFSTAGMVYYLLRRKTGRLYQILGSFAATQEVQLPDVSNIAVGEYFEFREDNTSALAEHTWSNGRSFLWATAIATNDLTLANPVSGADPVTADGQYVDWMARVSYEVLATTTDATGQTLFTNGQIKCTSVTGVQVGDWGLMHTSAATPWAIYTFGWGIFTVTAVDTTNRLATVVPRYPRQDNWAFGAVSNLNVRLKFLRPRALTPLVTASVASTNVATVASGAGISANDIIEIVQSTGGKMVSRLRSPAAIALVGRKVGTVARDTIPGDAVLNSNPFFSAWTGASNVPPDGYTSSGAGSLTRIAPLQYGTYAAEISNLTLRTPVVAMPCGYGQGRLSIGVVFRIKPGTGWDASTTASATLGLSLGGNSVTVYGPGNTSAPSGARKASEGETVTLTLENMDIEYTTASWAGVTATIFSALTLQVDCFLVWLGSRAPAQWSEYGQGTNLWQEVSARLAEVAAPETYDLSVLDIAAIDSTTYPYADLELGRPVRLLDPDSNTARSGLRIQQKYLVFYDPEQSRIVVSTRPRTLSEMLSGAVVAEKTGKITYGRRVEAR